MVRALFGYAGKLLRVDLTSGLLSDERLEEPLLRRYVGGTSLGVKYLYDEVPPEVSWSDPANRVIIASGPLGGTKVSGSGTISVVCKGAMTNMFTSTQANGFLGAYLKFCGYDGVIFQGAAADWLYLHLDDNGAELRDARALVGKDTWEIQDVIEAANPGRKYSVFGIGTAGEHLVRFAALVGDHGHAAPHNGTGAVLGAKKLKAIAVARGKQDVPVFDRAALAAASRSALAHIADDGMVSTIHESGTGALYSGLHAGGMLPVRNYTTSIFPEHERTNGSYTRAHYQNKKAPCWSCQVSCCRMTTVTEGRYAGYYGEEPEYEGFAATTSVIGNTDVGASVMLANLIDRLGLDINEAGWTLSFAMECFEKGLITESDADGLELTWGNVEGAVGLLHRIARREGKIGQLLADGVRVGAERLGGEAVDIGIYNLKSGNILSHDHRAMWQTLLDHCLSSTGINESSPGTTRVNTIGLEPLADKFDWEQVSTYNAKANGWRHWVDSLGICIFNLTHGDDLLAAFNATTGWKYSLDDAWAIGRRTAHRMRLYNMRCGLTPDVERPSPRYASDPVDGPAVGKGPAKYFDDMRRNYFRLMGWDEATGWPKPATLREAGLWELLGDLPSGLS